jgi:uncharacterized lipoprotein YehR (DUF1307 family)
VLVKILKSIKFGNNLNLKKIKMKKSIQLLALLLLSSVVFFSCSSSEKPEDVAKQFTKAMNEQKWEEANKLSDDNTKGLIKMMQSFSAMGGAAISKDSAAKLIAQMEVVKSEVKDSTAIVYFKNKVTSEEQQVPLKKINGKWLVAMKKEGMGDAGSANPEQPEDIAKAGMKAMMEQNMEELNKLVDDSSKMLLQMIPLRDPISKDSAAKLIAQMEVVNVTVNDTSAQIDFKDKVTSSEEKVELNKINGKWLIRLHK